MNKIENVSRRGFLKNLGFSSGALVLGVQFSALLPIPKALAQGLIATTDANKTSFEPNVYLTIHSDNTVAIVVHRSEMGQGIRTTIPMIVADELEADWQKIQVIQGLGDKKYGSQNTDGSRSIRHFYQPLREAGASARMMLEQAAAELWQVPINECQAIKNQVKHAKSNKIVAFGDLVAIAAKLAVPDKTKLVLKSKQDFRFIGKANVALVDGKDIVTGNATFGFDVELPNMRFAVIARPPVLAGKVKSFNSDKAKKINGVIDVIQLDDLTEPAIFKPLGGIAVIATNTWAAIQGRDALEVEWQAGEHGNYNSSSYKQALAKSCDNPTADLRQKGDVSAAFKNANRVVKADYFVPQLIHAPMEPPAATAHFHDGIIDIWACTQTPQSAQSNVAQAIGIAAENVNINVTLLGGGFGRKSKPDFVVEAALLSKQLNMPIKVLWTREDEIKNGYYHAVSYQKLSAGLDSSNKVIAWQHTEAAPTISSTFSKGADTIGFEASLGMIDVPFDIANVYCGAGKATAHTRIGWMRSVTNINHAFAVCSFADELAVASKTDSKDYLLALIGKDRHIDINKENAEYGNYGETLDKFPLDTARLKKVLTQVSNMANWHSNDKGKLPNGHVLGIAVHRSFASYVASVVQISTNAQGKIKLERIYMCVDCGIAVNPERIKSQMEGAAIFAISLAFYGEVTAKAGVIEQGNFDDYPIARMNEVPPIDVQIIASDAPPGGVGEPGVPPVAPAICNAIFAATGKRYRELPLNQYGII
ncbi:MAG: xanthine dehydrogenase family protein molybdopterin-binding subunit [Colwellia sp.]|nr:xanthine dehydrogenase family protein molybdopterin-binding subunit [Colwellia sp.]